MFNFNTPSLWEQQYYYSDIDCLIIGGGITGLNTALRFKNRHLEKRVLVVEALPQGYVASTRNAGFACFGSVGELLDDLDQLSEKEVTQLLSYRYQGLSLLRKTIGDETMNYQDCGGYELFRHGDPTFDKCREAIPRINQLIEKSIGLKETFSMCSHTVNTSSVLESAICNQYEGSLNPVMMMHELEQKVLKADVRILKGVSVEEIFKKEASVLLSNGMKINYGQVAICTNGLAKDLISKLDVETAPNIVGYATCKEDFKWNSCYHMDGGYIYFRRVDKTNIIIGGGRHILSTDLYPNLGDDDRIKKYLQETLNSLTNEKIELNGYWKGFLGIGKDRLPILENLGDNIFCGVRLGGMGVAIGSYLGQELANLMSD